ncbi:hypothetical protein TWF730_002982 [Orbilia blumenaviensis]|uniref:Uncharacterized protein n=1 Tax=Orbilia blumenaviensis TaxID=1796055 RepID=A0AAV9U7I4_9PEZI
MPSSPEGGENTTKMDIPSVSPGAGGSILPNSFSQAPVTMNANFAALQTSIVFVSEGFEEDAIDNVKSKIQVMRDIRFLFIRKIIDLVEQAANWNKWIDGVKEAVGDRKHRAGHGSPGYSIGWTSIFTMERDDGQRPWVFHEPRPTDLGISSTWDFLTPLKIVRRNQHCYSAVGYLKLTILCFLVTFVFSYSRSGYNEAGWILSPGWAVLYIQTVVTTASLLSLRFQLSRDTFQRNLAIFAGIYRSPTQESVNYLSTLSCSLRTFWKTVNDSFSFSRSIENHTFKSASTSRIAEENSPESLRDQFYSSSLKELRNHKQQVEPASPVSDIQKHLPSTPVYLVFHEWPDIVPPWKVDSIEKTKTQKRPPAIASRQTSTLSTNKLPRTQPLRKTQTPPIWRHSIQWTHLACPSTGLMPPSTISIAF